jgi:hypothetical protein
MPGLNDVIFDFSLESDLKERLWERMLERAGELAPPREEVSLESLKPQAEISAPQAEDDMQSQKKRGRTL